MIAPKFVLPLQWRSCNDFYFFYRHISNPRMTFSEKCSWNLDVKILISLVVKYYSTKYYSWIVIEYYIWNKLFKIQLKLFATQVGQEIQLSLGFPYNKLGLQGLKSQFWLNLVQISRNARNHLRQIIKYPNILSPKLINKNSSMKCQPKLQCSHHRKP